MTFDKIILAAHRGDRKKHPENTMPAFKAAIDFGVDMIETDVRMTKDGILILMHDRDTLRTTGSSGFTNEMTLDEIKKLDAGSQFSKDYPPTPVPTVEEFIALIKDTDVLVNWELKDYPQEVGEEFALRAVDRLIELIRSNGLEERSMVNSFNNRLLEYIYLKHGHQFPIHGQGIGACAKHTGVTTPDEILFDWCCLYPEEKGKSPLDYPHNFAYCLSHNILPCVCLADTPEIYRKALELGCRMFTSNDIYKAKELLTELIS